MFEDILRISHNCGQVAIFSNLLNTRNIGLYLNSFFIKIRTLLNFLDLFAYFNKHSHTLLNLAAKVPLQILKYMKNTHRARI